MHVSRARKLLDEAGAGRERLTTHGNGYVLHLETDELDALRFRALAAEGRRVLHERDPARAAPLLSEALGLWRGDLLDGLAPLAFVAAERSRFGELRLEALEDWFEAELDLGHHAEVAAELEHQVAEEPRRDRLRELAMLALYRCGRQTDALDLYQSGRRALSDELGLEPSPRLRKLEQAILRHDSDLELAALPDASGRRRATPAGRPRSQQPSSCSPLPASSLPPISSAGAAASPPRPTRSPCSTPAAGSSRPCASATGRRRSPSAHPQCGR